MAVEHLDLARQMDQHQQQALLQVPDRLPPVVSPVRKVCPGNESETYSQGRLAGRWVESVVAEPHLAAAQLEDLVVAPVLQVLQVLLPVPPVEVEADLVDRVAGERPVLDSVAHRLAEPVAEPEVWLLVPHLVAWLVFRLVAGVVPSLLLPVREELPVLAAVRLVAAAVHPVLRV